MAREYTHTVDWIDLRDRFLEACDSGQWTSQPAFDAKARKWHSRPDQKNDWEGSSIAQIRQWIAEGFHSPLFTTNPLEGTPRKRKRAHWSEDDGDIDVGRLYGGADAYMLTRGERVSRPGLTLLVNMSFRETVNAPAIAEYGAWIASLIGALESNGYDLEVNVQNVTHGGFGRDYDNLNTARIRVKRPNEISDFASWSVLFSPGGFRTLVFCAKAMMGDALGKTCDTGLGRPTGNQWNVERDGSTVTISPHCDARPGTCNDALTTCAKREGIL